MIDIYSAKCKDIIMDKKILSFVFGIFLLVSISAVIIYPGETKIYNNEMGITNLIYTIINNNTYVGELDMKINSTNISITFPQDMIPGSFDIVFLENKTNTVVQTIYLGGGGGGGGSRTRYVDRNVTEYRDVIKFRDKNIEAEVSEEISERIIDKIPKTRMASKIAIILLVLIILLLLLWNYYSSNKNREETTELKREVKEYE